MRRHGSRDRAKPRPDKHRINDQINAPEVRVIGADGSQVGVIRIEEAIRMAEEAGLDLVEVAEGASPPVCKILDYGKLKYREQKKAAEARKRTSTHTVKEIRIRYSTDTHDLDTKMRHARKFLTAGDRVKFQMRFRGREAVYKDLGHQIFDNLIEMLSDIADLEERTPLAGQRMTITFVPKVESKKEKEDEKEDDKEADEG